MECWPAILTTHHLIQQIKSRFPVIITPKIGCIPNASCKLELRPQSIYQISPSFIHSTRKVGNNLKKDNIILKMYSCDCGSPLEVNPKCGGTLRLCADLSHSEFSWSYHPIPRIIKILHEVRNSLLFLQLKFCQSIFSWSFWWRQL